MTITARGYMLEAEFDGQTLTARGTNKASHHALAGPGHKGDVVLNVRDIASLGYKKANPITNGEVTVVTHSGAKHQLHFRRKQGADFEALHNALQGARNNPHPGAMPPGANTSPVTPPPPG